jgi:glycosyltransferase involved in cell wall biosynthesis
MNMTSIVYVQYTDPASYPPLQNSSIIFAERGWLVSHLGIMASGAAREIEMTTHPRISVALQPAPGGGWRTAQHYAFFLAWCRSEILRLRPSVVYCSDFRSYPIGLWAARLPGVATILHEHDPPAASNGGWAAQMLRTVRIKFARSATTIIVPQDERARRFVADTGCSPDRIHVVYNCPLLRELETPQSGARDARRELTLWYHGALGRGQLPESVIDVLSHLPDDVRFEAAGYETVSSKGYVQRLLERARELCVGERVLFHGTVPDRLNLLHLAANADLGLALFSNRFRDPMVGASNKPFDYLACGLPLLTNRTPEWEGFFGAEGVSIGCDPENPDDIARAVLALRNDLARRRAMVENGRRLIETKWNYEAQFAKVIAAIEGGHRRMAPGDVAGVRF